MKVLRLKFNISIGEYKYEEEIQTVIPQNTSLEKEKEMVELIFKEWKEGVSQSSYEILAIKGKCQRCSHRELTAPHFCPYSQEYELDEKVMCNCCEVCQNECAKDV